MDKLPQYYQENGTFFQQNDYMNFEMMTNGSKTSLTFIKIPNFYVIDDKEYYAAEMKVKGLKIGTTALATEDILNIKLYDVAGSGYVRNLNFLIPPNANARRVSVEVFNEDTIFIRAPLKKKPPDTLL